MKLRSWLGRICTCELTSATLRVASFPTYHSENVATLSMKSANITMSIMQRDELKLFEVWRSLLL